MVDTVKKRTDSATSVNACRQHWNETGGSSQKIQHVDLSYDVVLSPITLSARLCVWRLPSLKKCSWATAGTDFALRCLPEDI